MDYAICDSLYYCSCVLTLCSLLKSLLSRWEERRKDLWVIISYWPSYTKSYMARDLETNLSKCKYSKSLKIREGERQRESDKGTIRISVSVYIHLLCCLKLKIKLAEMDFYHPKMSLVLISIGISILLCTFLLLQLFEFLKLVSLIFLLNIKKL